MSSPGSGKTTTLISLINRLKDSFNVAGMNVDIKTSLDACKVADKTGVPFLQINNAGLCHIDADMTARAIAEFDTGAHKNITILSVPEGDDKPLKYPLMYQVSDVVLINKMDTIGYFNFDLDKARKRILKLNPKAIIFPISAKTGQGIDEVCRWIASELESIKAK